MRSRPWHYDDPFFQEPPVAGSLDLDPWLEQHDLDALTVRTYDGLGLDVRSVLERSDLLPRDGKSQHAFCIDVDHEGDVRVLSNNRPSEYWAGTMLHEFGHALYDTKVDPELPWLLRSMHPLATEGVAMLFGRLIRDVEWLRAVPEIDQRELDELAPRLAIARRASLLTFARWVLVMTHFERGLYADPRGGPHEPLVGSRRAVPADPPPGRPAPSRTGPRRSTSRSPRSITRTTCTASWSRRSSRRRCATAPAGSSTGSKPGTCSSTSSSLPGLSVRWDALVEHATGEPLTARHLAAELRTG